MIVMRVDFHGRASVVGSLSALGDEDAIGRAIYDLADAPAFYWFLIDDLTVKSFCSPIEDGFCWEVVEDEAV